jgi:hypothetical protein
MPYVEIKQEPIDEPLGEESKLKHPKIISQTCRDIEYRLHQIERALGLLSLSRSLPYRLLVRLKRIVGHIHRLQGRTKFPSLCYEQPRESGQRRELELRLIAWMNQQTAKVTPRCGDDPFQPVLEILEGVFIWIMEHPGRQRLFDFKEDEMKHDVRDKRHKRKLREQDALEEQTDDSDNYLHGAQDFVYLKQAKRPRGHKDGV